MIGKVILYTGISAFVPAFVTLLVLSFQVTSFPRLPDHSKGLTAAFNERGVTYYITPQLATEIDWALKITEGAFVVLCLGKYLTQDKCGRPKNSN